MQINQHQEFPSPNHGSGLYPAHPHALEAMLRETEEELLHSTARFKLTFGESFKPGIGDCGYFCRSVHLHVQVA